MDRCCIKRLAEGKIWRSRLRLNQDLPGSLYIRSARVNTAGAELACYATLVLTLFIIRHSLRLLRHCAFANCNGSAARVAPNPIANASTRLVINASLKQEVLTEIGGLTARAVSY